MRKKHRTLLAFALAATTAVQSGCATSNWFGQKPESNMDAAIANAKSGGGSPMNDPEFWQKLSQPSKPGITDRISNAFSSAGEALTFEPTRIPAPDPTSLATEAPELSADLMVASGRVAETQGKNDVAIANYESALKKEPEHLGAMRALGRHHDRAGDFAKAISWYQKAIKAHPKESAAYNDLGLCLARHGKLADSKKAFEKAVSTSPKNPLYRNNLATVMVEQGDVDLAYNLLSEVSGESVANYNIGFLLSQRGHKETAAIYLKKAIAADPSLQQAESLLASLDLEPASPSDSPNRTPAAQPKEQVVAANGNQFQVSDSFATRPSQPRTYQLSEALPEVQANDNVVENPYQSELQTVEASQPKSSYAKYFTSVQDHGDNIGSNDNMPAPQVRKLPPASVAAAPIAATPGNAATVRYASRVLGLPVTEPAEDVMAAADAETEATPRVSVLPPASTYRIGSSAAIRPMSELNESTNGGSNGNADSANEVRRLPGSLPPLRPLPY